MIGKTTDEVFSTDQADLIVARDREALRSGRARRRISTSRARWTDACATSSSKRVAIGGKDDEPEYLLNVIEDVTERKRNETRIAHLAHHDPLTDLPNRAALKPAPRRDARTAPRHTARNSRCCASISTASRRSTTSTAMPPATTCCSKSRRRMQAAGRRRLPGARSAATNSWRSAPTGRSPRPRPRWPNGWSPRSSGDIDCDGRKVQHRHEHRHRDVSRPTAPTAVTLLRNADAALYRAKAEGRGAIRFFEAEMDRMLHDRRALQADLALAVSRNELQLYYQPQARVAGPDHRLRGAAALGSSAPRLRAARHLHSARGGKRPDRPDRRMGAARSLPRGGVLAQAAADRDQPLAGAVAADANSSRWCIRCCWRPGLRPTGWCSRSPKAR